MQDYKKSQTQLSNFTFTFVTRVSQVALVVKNLPDNAGDKRDAGSIPGLGRSSEEGNGNPLQYSCLKNPIDRGAWWATIHRVTKSWTHYQPYTKTCKEKQGTKLQAMNIDENF